MKAEMDIYSMKRKTELGFDYPIEVLSLSINHAKNLGYRRKLDMELDSMIDAACISEYGN
jgi:hypothetical protein